MHHPVTSASDHLGPLAATPHRDVTSAPQRFGRVVAP